MSDNDTALEILSQLENDEGFIEATELLNEASEECDHDSEDHCGACIFMSHLHYFGMLGQWFAAGDQGDEECGSPFDVADWFTGDKASDSLPTIGALSDAIASLNRVLAALSLLTWHNDQEVECEEGD